MMITQIFLNLFQSSSWESWIIDSLLSIYNDILLLELGKILSLTDSQALKFNSWSVADSDFLLQ